MSKVYFGTIQKAMGPLRKLQVIILATKSPGHQGAQRSDTLLPDLGVPLCLSVLVASCLLFRVDSAIDRLNLYSFGE